MCLNHSVWIRKSSPKQQFVFENKWLLEDNFTKKAKESWWQTNTINSLPDRLEACGKHFVEWARQEVGNSKRNIEKLVKELDTLQSYDDCADDEELICNKERELEKLLLQGEIYWQQRAKKQWLNMGDSNTTFFHRCTKSRRNRNRIDYMADEEGREWRSDENIGRCITEYYSNLFKSREPKWEVIDQALRFVEPCLNEDMKNALDREFTDEEIKKAAFDLNPSKAPGPDGFTAGFFHQLWDDIKSDICFEVKEILNNGKSLEKWNNTIVTLIPKTKKPKTVKEYRPISLCNVSYKSSDYHQQTPFSVTSNY